MAVSQAFAAQNRREPRKEHRALVVVLSALQLALVVLVWLLAIVPVAIMALCAAVFQAAKPAGGKARARTARTALGS